jgi:hypothetical protein
LLHRGEPDSRELSAYLVFPVRAARLVRISFPEKPIDVEELRVY